MRDRNNHISRPVRTARAIVQHHNAAIHITMHNAQSVLILYLCLWHHISDAAIRRLAKNAASPVIGWFIVAVTAFITSSSPLITGIDDYIWRVYHPLIYPGQLSLAIPPWVGAISTKDGFGHLWEETAPLKLRLYGAL